MASGESLEKKIVGNYILKEKLGQGQYGVVYKGIIKVKGQQNKVVAIKQVKKSDLNEYQKNTYDQEKFNLASLADHPNIVQFYEMLQTENNYYIVMNYCNGGTLHSYCQNNNYKLEESKVQFFAAQILSGLKYMKQKGIIHRDLKPENILLDIQFDQIRLKISDLGLSKALKDGDYTFTSCGTPLFASPEILNLENYNFKADV